MGWSCCVLEESGELWCLLGESVVFSLGLGEGGMFFFRFELKQTETQSVSVVFRFVSRNQKTFFSLCFGLFRCFGPVKTTETNRIFSKQTEKISKKHSLLGGPRNHYFFFSVQTETNRNSICFGCFSVCFFVKPKKFFPVCFGLFRCFGLVSRQPKQTELMVF